MSKFQGGKQDRRLPKKTHTINREISATQMRVIGANGENIGVVTRSHALSLAEEAGLDLVQISGDRDNVVAKIMDFGKFLYEKKKQDGRAKKAQKVIQIKELKLRPGIGEQDYRVKLKRAQEFLEGGKRVKFTIQCRRGREAAMMDTVGAEMFTRITVDLAELGLGQLVEEKEQRGRVLWSKVFYIKGK